MSAVTVVGGGLAGCEAAWQLAEAGVHVRLLECKPAVFSPAHKSELLAEIVCSNSLRSDLLEAPAGLLKAELRRARSLIMACADATRVPAGEALAVDRHAFSLLVTDRISQHPRIVLERRTAEALPDGPAIVATGPLTAGPLADDLAALDGRALYFYDAIAPILDAETIDQTVVFRASRWGHDSPAVPSHSRQAVASAGAEEGGAGGDGGADGSSGADAADGSGGGAPGGDYLNCPLDEGEYRAFVDAVRAGRKVLPHAFEEAHYFEGCLPIEVMAERGDDVLAFGPMKPVGLTDPRTGRRPFAVVQLRPENRHLTAYNMVGFQTRLAYPEQQRIFRMLPGLAQAEFLRLGSIHRNSYVDAPRVLDGTLALRARSGVRLAGQMTGVEGYIESTAMGLLAARFAVDEAAGRAPRLPPPESATGGLLAHVTRMRAPNERFEPMNINFGLLPPWSGRLPKRERRRLQAERALAAFTGWA